jgi:cellobiose-specific phosphotransferase system component IIA
VLKEEPSGFFCEASQAARLLMQALKLHEAGRNAEAHELTVQAANCLEDAVSIEGFVWE